MRVTRKELEAKLERFAKYLGTSVAPFGHGADNVGKLVLDHNGCGYTIELVVNEGGAVSHPFGYQRHSAKSLVDVLDFANAALYFQQQAKA